MKKFDLQLFATEIPANATFGKKMSEAEARIYYTDEANEALYEAYTGHKYFDTFTHPKNKGKKGRDTVYEKMITNGSALQEGVLPKEDEPFGKYYIDYTLDSFGGYIWTTPELDLYSLDSGESTRLHRAQINAAGELFQNKVGKILASTTNVFFAGVDNPTSLATAEEATTEFNLNDFMTKIKPFLTRAKVKGYEGGQYLVILPPEVLANALTTKKNSGEYTLAEIALNLKNPTTLTEGEIGTFNNFKFIEDTEGLCQQLYTKEDGTAVYGCLVLGRFRGEKGAKIAKLEGYGEMRSIVKDVGSAGANDPIDQRGSLGWRVDGWGGYVKYPQAVLLYECAGKNMGGEYAVENYPNYAGGYDKNGNERPVNDTTSVVVNNKVFTGSMVTIKSTFNGKENGKQDRFIADNSITLGNLLETWRSDEQNVNDYTDTDGLVDIYTNIECTTKATDETTFAKDTTLYVKAR